MKPISAELRRDIEEDKKAQQAERERALPPPIPAASEEDESNPEYLETLFIILADQYRREQTISWSELAQDMRKKTGLRWDENRYSVLKNAAVHIEPNTRTPLRSSDFGCGC